MNDNELMILFKRRVSLLERIKSVVRGGADELPITEIALVSCRILIKAIDDLRLAIQQYNEALGDTVQADPSLITAACLAQAGCQQELERSAKYFAHLPAQSLACFGTPINANSDGISEPTLFRTAFESTERFVRVCVHIDQHKLTFCENYP